MAKLYLDDWHPSPLGHKMIASILAFAIETEIFARTTSKEKDAFGHVVDQFRDAESIPLETLLVPMDMIGIFMRPPVEIVNFNTALFDLDDFVRTNGATGEWKHRHTKRDRHGFTLSAHDINGTELTVALNNINTMQKLAVIFSLS